MKRVHWLTSCFTWVKTTTEAQVGVKSFFNYLIVIFIHNLISPGIILSASRLPLWACLPSNSAGLYKRSTCEFLRSVSWCRWPRTVSPVQWSYKYPTKTLTAMKFPNEDFIFVLNNNFKDTITFYPQSTRNNIKNLQIRHNTITIKLWLILKLAIQMHWRDSH